MRSSVSRTEALLLTILFLVSPLPADSFYESNPLMQKTGTKDSLTGEGWELSVSDSSLVLYLDGEEKESKTFTSDGYIHAKDGISTTVTLDREGRPTVLIAGDEKTVNSYSGSGALESTVVTVGDEIRSIRKYFYSYDGTPVRTDMGDSVYIFSRDDFYYSLAEDEGWAIRKVGSNLYVRDTAEGSDVPSVEEEDGLVTVRISENESVSWDEEGNKTEEKDEKGVTRYAWLDGVLVTEERTEGDFRYLMHYEDGILKSRETYEKDELSTVIRYAQDGTMQKDMYRKGKPYATVSYDRDGSTVLDVEML